jgi:hypothetical protein
VSIKPKGYYRSNARNELTLFFERTGSFTLMASTNISGESSSHAQHTSDITIKKTLRSMGDPLGFG